MGAVETPIEHQETHQSQAVWGWGIRKWGSGARAREESLGANGGGRVITCLLTLHSGRALHSLAQAIVCSFIHFFKSAHLPSFLPLSPAPSFSFPSHLSSQAVNWT